MIIKGTTSTGFQFEIEKNLLADAEFLELFADVQEGGQGAMKTFALLRKALGEAQKKRLYDHCRNDDGIVPVEELKTEIADIFAALNENPETKN